MTRIARLFARISHLATKCDKCELQFGEQLENLIIDFEYSLSNYHVLLAELKKGKISEELLVVVLTFSDILLRKFNCDEILPLVQNFVEQI